MKVDDDLSTALGTETLADRDMVPLASTTTPGSSADTLPIEIFEHRKVPEGRVQCRLALWTKGAQDPEMQPLQ
jgi:hypothetical protein